MNTIKTLNLALLTLGAFVFTYLMGHVIMSILFYLEITDFVISKDMDTILHFAFGLPILWIQIQIVKFAKQLTNNLN